MLNSFQSGLRIAIIGSSGAIGSGFVGNLQQGNNIHNSSDNSNSKKPAQIFCFSRHNAYNENCHHDNIFHHYIDIEDEEKISDASKFITSPLDMVIVTTGILHKGENLFPEKSIKELSFEKFHKIYAVNTIGPAIVGKYFLPLLNKNRKSVFAFISARVSSVSDNYLGGWYSYRASKTALNMVIKNFAIEIGRSNKNAIIIGLHPGTVESKLSQPFQKNVKSDKLFSNQYSTEKMLEVIDGLQQKDTGKLFAYDGTEILP